MILVMPEGAGVFRRYACQTCQIVIVKFRLEVMYFDGVPFKHLMTSRPLNAYLWRAALA
jgi:hypothetical protein